MRKRRLITAGLAALVSSGLAATVNPVACKPVKHYGVSGCEVLADQTCPVGYHKQIVDPPNPMMKSPSYMMCVEDKPPTKTLPSKAVPKPNH